jgi:hypothetical protein
MIVLFTDFGLYGPYTGQVKAVLHQMAPGVPAIDLFADAPVGNPKASAYLLAVYAACARRQQVCARSREGSPGIGVRPVKSRYRSNHKGLPPLLLPVCPIYRGRRPKRGTHA